MFRRAWVLVLVLITAGCAAYPALDDYGPETELETVQVIIHPLRRRDKAMETSARAGAVQKPKPIRNEDKPYFNSRVGVFLFQAPTLALSRQLAVMTHQILLNERRFRFIGLIDRPAAEVGGENALRRAVDLGREMGYDLVVVGECLDLFNGVAVAPSRVSLRLRILDAKRAATAWLIIGRKAVRPRPTIDTPWGEITGRNAPDATALAHYLLRAMLEKI
jgi:hypothetical protein